MKRSMRPFKRRIIRLVLIAVLALASMGCKISDIGGVVGDVGDGLKNMFKGIGGGFGF
jgi:hypothetical protein